MERAKDEEDCIPNQPIHGSGSVTGWRSAGVFKEEDGEGLRAVCSCLVISEVS